ncbi:MAG: AMP-binding protein, partial [Treponema sp.]|nr:AMP-binding protein [Treponema sp.]
MLEKFLPRAEFDSYEDFYKNYSVNIPENFNFAWDVMDVRAAETPNERALVWCDEAGAEAEFTYGDLKRLSDKAASLLIAAGFGKGDPVMLILKRRHEYWPIILALHKIGAICIPATHLLTTKDMVYRCDAAGVAGIICVDDEQVMLHVDEALAKLSMEKKPALRYKAFVRSVHTPADAQPGERAERAAPGSPLPWVDFSALWEKASDDFTRPAQANANDDIMLLYFTSGTTGMPKMVRHNFAYPLGHILTSKYWHQSAPGGLHLTVADTGWAKAAWGK